MPVPDRLRREACAREGWFVTTHWSVVLASKERDATTAAAALEQLCQAYWFPIYSFARRLGHDLQDAEDLTQGFFAYFLRTDLATKARPERGRFRSFLLATFKHFRAGEWDRARAQRRGGGQAFVSWELHQAEERYASEPREGRNPEQWYEWSWAMALLDRVIGRLEAEFASAGKQWIFESLKPCLLGGSAEKSYAEIGAVLGKTEAAVKEAVRRMRLRYRELFREEVAQTVATEEEIEEELRHIVRVLGA